MYSVMSAPAKPATADTEPATLADKLTARLDEMSKAYERYRQLADACKDAEADAFWPQVELARRRAAWAALRHTEACAELDTAQKIVSGALGWHFTAEIEAAAKTIAKLRAKIG